MAPDFRGFGWSEYPADEDFRKETLVDDLVALCAELGHERIGYVGHDWGCWVGWLLCLRKPDLVDRAVLLSAPPPFPPDRVEPAALGRLGRLAYQLPIAAPMPSAAKLVCLRLLGAVFGGRAPDEADVYVETLASGAGAGEHAAVPAVPTREVGPLLARRYAGQRLTVPVHYLVGDEDLLFYEGIVDEPAPHADAEYRGEVLRGVGHFIPDEVPDLLRDRVLGLLGAQGPQGKVSTPR